MRVRRPSRVGTSTFAPENRLVEADGQIQIDVEILAAKIWVRRDAGHDKQITRVSVGGAGLAAALDADTAAIFHAGGDADIDRFEFSIAVDLQG